jgi:flagellar hook-associated protein 2
MSATANIDGAAGGASDGTATVSGSTITVTDGGAKGLKLFFSGFSVADSVDLDFTVGVGAQLYFAISELLERSGTVAGGDLRRGAVEAELDQLEDQNEVHNDRITEMLARLEIQRNSLLERFLKMEQALYTGNRILDSIKQATEAMFGSNN